MRKLTTGFQLENHWECNHSLLCQETQVIMTNCYVHITSLDSPGTPTNTATVNQHRGCGKKLVKASSELNIFKDPVRQASTEKGQHKPLTWGLLHHLVVGNKKNSSNKKERKCNNSVHLA